MTEDVLTIDFETRSAADLKKVGAWPYSLHDSTKVLCLAYAFNDEEDVGLWHCAHPAFDIEESPPPERLLRWIENGALVEAHNAFFERSIWKNVCVRRMGWSQIRHEQWRCTASRAAASSLPRALEDLARVLRLKNQKDVEGGKSMLKLAKPKKPTKAEAKELRARGVDPDTVVLWHETEAEVRKNWEYCKQDVRTEREASSVLRPLRPLELRVWQLDQLMNERGIHVDRRMAEQALELAATAKEELNGELSAMTGLQSATQRQAVKAWLAEEEGVELPDTKGKTLAWYLGELDDEADEDEDEEPSFFAAPVDLTPRARRVIEIVRAVNRTSTKKYDAMLRRSSDEDDRIRDAAMYCGAGTGRWTGKGFQPHNFPRGGVVERNDGTFLGFKDMDLACDSILTGDYELCRMLYGDVMDLLSRALRGAICASPGRELLVGDFAAIEARVVFWIARCLSALKIFASGKDIYVAMASDIYGRPINKKEHPVERQFGKQAILGLGFGMGFPKFLVTCRGYGITFTRRDVQKIVHDYAAVEAWIRDNGRDQVARSGLVLEDNIHELVLMKHVVDVYREGYPEVPEMWKAQERAAIAAAQSPGREVSCGVIRWMQVGRALHCKLPSGRLLSYWDPQVRETPTPWGEKRLALTYMSVDQKTKRWTRTHTYGGKIIENIVQATARDLMAEAMLRAEDRGWPLVLTVHDEIGSEIIPGSATKHDLEAVMADRPDWATDCPVDAEAWAGVRYRK